MKVLCLLFFHSSFLWLSSLFFIAPQFMLQLHLRPVNVCKGLFVFFLPGVGLAGSDKTRQGCESFVVTHQACGATGGRRSGVDVGGGVGVAGTGGGLHSQRPHLLARGSSLPEGPPWRWRLCHHLVNLSDTDGFETYSASLRTAAPGGRVSRYEAKFNCATQPLARLGKGR